jgi:hypothetical protein
VVTLALVVAVVAVVVPRATSGAAGTPVTTISLHTPWYQPRAEAGTTDDYHCTLIDPHVRHDSYIVSSKFTAGSVEDHHAALFLVPPAAATAALRSGVLRHGWTCFGEAALPGTSIFEFLKNPMLSEWAPGHGADVLPLGTGIPLPKGSLVVIQVHYNLLVGHRPVRNRLVLKTVPANAPIKPLKLDIMLAAPNIPCPTGSSGPLCSPEASLVNQGVRFGPAAEQEAAGIDGLCHIDPTSPPASDTASCDSVITNSGYIVRTQAHMHLLGVSFKMVLDPGTSRARTVLGVPEYNFHYQRAYNLAHPVPVTAGEPVRVTCTYNPQLEQELPDLRRVAPHFVTWGDGSTDEMCIGLAYIAHKLPKGVTPAA